MDGITLIYKRVIISSNSGFATKQWRTTFPYLSYGSFEADTIWGDIFYFGWQYCRSFCHVLIQSQYKIFPLLVRGNHFPFKCISMMQVREKYCVYQNTMLLWCLAMEVILNWCDTAFADQGCSCTDQTLYDPWCQFHDIYLLVNVNW